MTVVRRTVAAASQDLRGAWNDRSRPRPVVETSGGRIAGRWRSGAMFFGGIPYAASPTGRRRFAPPDPPDPWAGVRDARCHGPDGIGGFIERRMPLGTRRSRVSEDCLHLNVQTAGLDGARPVLVWLHGGGFAAGSASAVPQDGAVLARREGLVVVTPNYRLGPLGWLHLGDIDERYLLSGNLGLLDQMAALRWVQENIAGFGGDPGNVTLAGESAGAMSVAVLMGCASADHLFGKAIAQSGAAQATRSREEADALAREVMAELGVRDVDVLQEVPAFDLAWAGRTVSLRRSLRRPWSEQRWIEFGPVVDGVLVEGDPLASIAGPGRPPRPLLTGTNRDESSFQDPDLTVDEVSTWLEGLLGARSTDALALYQGEAASADASAIYNAAETDRRFRIPALRLAAANAGRGAATFTYRFDWHPAGSGLGACHAVELPFVFGVTEPWRRGPHCLLSGFDPPASLAAWMTRAWARFAQTGRPAPPAEWPSWPATGRGGSMVIDDPHRSVEDIDEERLRVWASST